MCLSVFNSVDPSRRVCSPQRAHIVTVHSRGRQSEKLADTRMRSEVVCMRGGQGNYISETIL